MTPRTITDQSSNRWLICSTESHWSDYCWFTFVSHRTLYSSHIFRILKTRSEKLIGRISGGAQYLASIDWLIFVRFFSCDNFILIRGLYYLISNEASISKEASRFLFTGLVYWTWHWINLYYLLRRASCKMWKKMEFWLHW